jgi:predicted nucleic acid-binding protein
VAALTLACDTSFLISFYSENEHTDHAARLIRRLRAPLQVTRFLDFEFVSGIHHAIFRGAISEADSRNAFARYSHDLATRHLNFAEMDLLEVLDTAKKLAIKHSGKGYRGFDIIHVAAALRLEATTFLTFDRNQQKLAVAEGLKSPW